jgi:hypothetical protein
MAVAGIRISGDFPDLVRLREGIQNIGNKRVSAQLLGDALRKAIKPSLNRLRQLTPVGPTGNLKRAATSKVKTYAKDGGAVALVGYRRAGRADAASAAGGSVLASKDRAFHQWWLERGTRSRQVAKFANKPYQRRSPTTPFTRIRNGQPEVVRGKGTVHWVTGQNAYIASSFSRLGPFQFVKASDRSRVQTQPGYPGAFFRKSRNPIIIPAMPVGGEAGIPPVKTAWDQTRSQVAEILTRELSASYERVLQTLTFNESGSITEE